MRTVRSAVPTVRRGLPTVRFLLPTARIGLPTIRIGLPTVRFLGPTARQGRQGLARILYNDPSPPRRSRMPRYDVFLSHAGADKPAVETLARKLQEAGIELFLDKWHLVPGEPWQEALEEALDQSHTCAVFLGKALGPWQNEEMRSALETRVGDVGFRVIPVLLPGGKEPGKEELPRFLRRLTWVDFRAGLDDQDTFRHLVAGIRGEAPGPGGGVAKPSLPYRCMAPPREPFVQRSEYAQVRDALLTGATVGITTAIHGAGGFGKTAMAIELCYDEQVRARYPDGILWTTMGEEIDDAGRLARVRDLIRWWSEEDPPAFETVSAVSAYLRQALNGKRVLLVVDDVWRSEDLTPFQGLDSKAVLLCTTRDSRTLPVESVPIHVDAMEVPDAVQLLRTGLPHEPAVDLQGLATRLGEWPLLLKMVNRQLRELVQSDGLSLVESLREAEEALDAEGLTAFDREDLEARGQAVARTVGASLKRLSSDDVSRFEPLAIFPEDKDIPVRVLEKLWGMGSFATKKLCGRLHDLSLLLRFERATGTIRLHDVIRAYLLKRGESHLSEWNRRFLDFYRPANGRWSDLPREESYLWTNLFYHLLETGQSETCRELLLDFQYLRSKLGATDINALLGDYSPFVEKDQELELVRDALRLSAHVLAKNPLQLREQLWGRLLDWREGGIRDVLQAGESPDVPWLRPRRANLTRPGGPLITSIEHPGRPNALAVLSGNRVVSGSYDGALRVWDVESGQTLQTLEGHSYWVDAVAVLDNRRVVSGSYDGTLRVWDVESGQTLQILEGHSDKVTTVAVLDNRHVVSCSYDGTLRVWDVESGQTLQTLEGHSDRVLAVAVLDRRRVVSGSEDGTLRVWDVKSGQAPQALERHSDRVLAVAVLDSRRVVSGSNDGTLQVWDVESGQTLQTLKGHSNWIRTVAVLDSRRVVSGSDDRTLRVWDVESGKVECLFTLDAPVGAVAVISDLRIIVAGDHSGRVHFFDFVEP